MDWIGHRGCIAIHLRREGLVCASSFAVLVTARTATILRSQRSFYTGATGLEACDWPSQNEAVQLNTEKAVSTRGIENNRENGPKCGENGVKCNKGGTK